MLNPIADVIQFEQAINSRNPDAICSLRARNFSGPRRVLRGEKLLVAISFCADC
jgi:hypothetical protein